MKELSPLEQLDVILNSIAVFNDGKMGIPISQIIMESNTTIENKIFPYFPGHAAVLYKLIKDGYIEERISQTTNKGEKRYFITFEGLVFNERGGYITQKTISDQNEKRIVRNEKLLLWWTFLAGAMAMLLLFWQIFLYFYPIHADYPYWIWQTI
jgi:hypothetical protein